MKYKKRWNPVYGRMGLIILSAGAVAVLVFLTDNSRSLPQTEDGYRFVVRNPQGQGEREEELEVAIGDMEDTYTVQIPEQEYTEEEIQTVFAEAKTNLETLVLGENESLDEVRYDLNLVEEVPDTGIHVSWETDHYEAINTRGELQTENLSEEGTLVELKALMTYSDKKEEYVFYANLFPPIQSRTEQLLKGLREEAVRLDEESRTARNMPLPKYVGDQAVTWRYQKNYRAVAVLLLGMVGAAMLYESERQKKKEEKKKRERQMSFDYPQMINSFTLFLGSGMTVRNVWRRLAEDYEKQKETRGTRAVYEEMVYTMREIQDGRPEGECYERFGERCGIQLYRKFGTMLSQNLKKGTRGLTVLLQQEAEEALEERKNMAKQLGEEAGTKMLIPMFLMLAVVLVIIVIPAFLSIQI